MARYSRKLKLKAAFALEWAHHNLAKAVRRLEKTCHGKIPADPRAFITRWHTNLTHELNLEGKPGRGRKSKVNDATIQEVLLEFCKGQQVRVNAWKGWRSFPQAVRHNRQLRKMVKAIPLSKRRIFQRMLEVGGSVQPPCACT